VLCRLDALLARRARRAPRRLRLRIETLEPAVADEVPVGGATEQRQPELQRELVPHLRDAAARDDDRHAHLRRLDHHLARQPPGGVEDLVALRRLGRPFNFPP
jgi:hypothetical protein